MPPEPVTTESAGPGSGFDLGSKAVCAALCAADFLAGPEAFVARCAAIAVGRGRAVDPSDEARLVAALRAGRTRLEVAEALIGDDASPVSPASAYGRPWDAFAVVALLERFAPEDDRRFVDQVHAQLLDRRPTPIEALEAEFDLRCGHADRRGIIARVAALSPFCRLSEALRLPGSGAGCEAPGDGEAQPNGAERPDKGRAVPEAPGTAASDAAEPVLAEAILDPGAGRRLVIARQVVGVGLILGPGMQCPGLETGERLAEVPAGWVMTGPKRGLAPGRWRLSIDLLQPEGAEIVLDVVANAGLDTLLGLTLAGPAHLSAGFEVAPTHHFVEIRIQKPAQPEPLHRLDLRSLMLEQVS